MERFDQVKLAYQIGIKFEASAAWKIFRCRADDDKSIRVKRLTQAIALISTGEYSIREVADLTGYAKNTVWKLLHKVRAMRQREGLDEICCPCGTPLVTHRGWCKYRYEKSEKRQDFIQNVFGKIVRFPNCRKADSPQGLEKQSQNFNTNLDAA